MRVTPAFALAATVAALTLAAPAPSVAQTCQRTVSVSPQASAGEGTSTLTFAVYSGGCAAAAEVSYEATAGIATPGTDFRLPRGTLRWAAGDTAVLTVTVVILLDSLRENAIEDFTVRLGNASPGARIIQSMGQGRILDDDGPTVFVVDDRPCPPPSPLEKCSCDLFDTMPIRPYCPGDVFTSAPPLSPVTLHWSTIDGTAKAGIDFVPVVDGTF